MTDHNDNNGNSGNGAADPRPVLQLIPGGARPQNFPPDWIGQTGIVVLRLFAPDRGFLMVEGCQFVQDLGANGIVVRVAGKSVWGPPGYVVVPKDTIQALSLPSALTLPNT